MVIFATAFISFINWNAFTGFATVTVFAMINTRLLLVFVQVQVVVIAQALVAFFCQGTFAVATVYIGAVVDACQGRVTFPVKMVSSAYALIALVNWDTFTSFTAFLVLTISNARLLLDFVQV